MAQDKYKSLEKADAREFRNISAANLKLTCDKNNESC
jgi:hypothetical protein